MSVSRRPKIFLDRPLFALSKPCQKERIHLYAGPSSSVGLFFRPGLPSSDSAHTPAFQLITSSFSSSLACSSFWLSAPSRSQCHWCYPIHHPRRCRETKAAGEADEWDDCCLAPPQQAVSTTPRSETGSTESDHSPRVAGSALALRRRLVPLLPDRRPTARVSRGGAAPLLPDG